jgi:acetylornithine deacetylase
LLCSHIDTVPVCSGWTHSPFEAVTQACGNQDEKIIGLGANDALSSVVSIIYGFINTHQAFKDNKLSGRLIAAIVCEEEKGNQGFVRIEPKLPKYDYAIFGEPTNLKIGYCMRGSMKLKAYATGKSCHASRPHEGKNAIYEVAEVLNKLKSLPLTDDSPWGCATCEPVMIEGGVAENQIPDKVSILLDSRPTWKVNNEKILELLTNAGINFEVIRNIRRAQHCPTESVLIKSIQTALPETSLYPFGGSCDMAFATKPSVILGPGSSERSHAADEYILKSELISGCQTYYKICNVIFQE